MIKLAILVLVLIVGARNAVAGPFCGRIASFAPAPETTVPVGATVAMFTEDFYYNGQRRAFAKSSRVRATIDGINVPISVRDVRATDGVIRYITVRSRKAGKLELFVHNPWTKAAEIGATYTVSSSWTAPATPTATVERSEDRRLGPYHWTGELAAVRTDAPAIGFTLKWRGSAKQAWSTLAVPALLEDRPSARTEARLGQTMCGMTENIPLQALVTGIEAELVADLPDGRRITLDLNRIAIAPAPKSEPRVSP